MKYRSPFGWKTRSFGLLSRLPSYLSASVTNLPSTELGDAAVAVLAQDELAVLVEREAVGAGFAAGELGACRCTRSA